MTLIDGSQSILLRSLLSLLRRMWDVWNSTFLMLLRALLSTQRVSFPSCTDPMVTFICNQMLLQRPTIAPVPFHLKEATKASLFHDVEHGIIAPVQVGTLTEWCSTMVVTAKKDDHTPPDHWLIAFELTMFAWDTPHWFSISPCVAGAYGFQENCSWLSGWLPFSATQCRISEFDNIHYWVGKVYVSLYASGLSGLWWCIYQVLRWHHPGCPKEGQMCWWCFAPWLWDWRVVLWHIWLSDTVRKERWGEESSKVSVLSGWCGVCRFGIDKVWGGSLKIYAVSYWRLSYSGKHYRC